MDPVGHNVEASVGTDLSYDLTSRVNLLSQTPSGGWKPGASTTWRMSAFNTGPEVTGAGWGLTMLLPKGSKPALPPANAMRTCTKGTSSAGYPFVRCVGRGPLSPGVTSFAVDVSAVIPSTTNPGTQLDVVVYVQPAAGQGPELNPLGTPPAGPSVDTSLTATDNDSSGLIAVG